MMQYFNTVSHGFAAFVINLGIPGGDLNLGPFHFSFGFGVAIQIPGFGAKHFAYETYATGSAGLGIGLGVSYSPGVSTVGIGRGNLDGFNGLCAFGGIYAQPFTSIEYEYSLSGDYQGLQIGTPHAGLDVEAYGGFSYTEPLGIHGLTF